MQTLTCRLVHRHATVHIQILGHNEVPVCHLSTVRCLCFDGEHRRISWILGQHQIKIVMVTDALPMTRKDLARSSLNISNFYYFNTVLHQGTLQGRQTTDKSNVLLPTSSNAPSFVRWTVTLFNHASSHC